ncbi:MAG TPA: hypothetical protein VFR67_25340 [Pilimelia sp.]|nr:hypothetical protein [Pilimelia sp.]
MGIRRGLRGVAVVGALCLALVGAAPAAQAAGGKDAGSTTGAAISAKSSTGETTTVKTTRLPIDKAASHPGTAAPAAGAKGGPSTQWVVCWDGFTVGPWFHEICDGDIYWPYVDCTDGFRYVSTVAFSGAWEFWLRCPDPYLAIWGGAYTI